MPLRELCAECAKGSEPSAIIILTKEPSHSDSQVRWGRPRQARKCASQLRSQQVQHPLQLLVGVVEMRGDAQVVLALAVGAEGDNDVGSE